MLFLFIFINDNDNSELWSLNDHAFRERIVDLLPILPFTPMRYPVLGEG